MTKNNLKNKNLEIYPNWNKMSEILNFQKKDFENLLENFLQDKKEIYQEIKKIKKEERNFENTILKLEYGKNENEYQDIFNYIHILQITHKDKIFRDMCEKFLNQLSQKETDLIYDKEIFFSISDYLKNNFKKEENILDKRYGYGSKKLVLDYFKDYKKMGFNLENKFQKKIKDNLNKMQKLNSLFMKNLAEKRKFILCSKEELEGYPENLLKNLEKKDNQYKITLDYPIYNPFMSFVKNRKKRKELNILFSSKGGKENLKILEKYIFLKDENSKILGYKNYAEYILEERMAKTEKKVRDFLDKNIKNLSISAKKDVNLLFDFAKKNLEDYKDLKKLENFDISFVANKYKEEKFKIDSKKVREYFELDNTLKEIFKIFSEIFSFSFREIEEKEKQEKNIILADEKIKLFEFKDLKSKKVLAYFILDLFPRDGKYTHACSAIIISQRKNNLNNILKNFIPLNQIICNFQEPKKDNPSLLSLGEVETLIHEFGHACHKFYTDVWYASQGTISTSLDFVEIPSQFLEDFLFQKKYFNRLARHYATGKKMDENLLNKIIESRNFLNAFAYLNGRILGSVLDLNLYTNKIKVKDSTKYYLSLQKKYFNFDVDKSITFPSSFEHIIDGYEAGYYSYMWSLVYAKDVFSEFKKHLNQKIELKKIGEKYKKEILSVGSSREELISIEKFLGRKMNEKAFLEDLI